MSRQHRKPLAKKAKTFKPTAATWTCAPGDDLYANQDPKDLRIEALVLHDNIDSHMLGQASVAAEEYASEIWTPDDGNVELTVIATHKRSGRKFSVDVGIEIDPTFYTNAKEI